MTKRKKNFAHAELVSVNTSSPLRTIPACPYFGTCGGCQLQHLHYSAQLEQKRLWVEDSLKRIGHLTIPEIPPVVPAEQQWAYRRHISLNLTPAVQGYTAGYIAVDNQSLLEIKQCPIFTSPNEDIITPLQTIAHQLESLRGNVGKVTLFKGNEGRYLFYFHFKQLPSNAQSVGENALRHSKIIQGIQFNAPKRTVTIGQTAVALNIEGLSFQVSPRSFVQNHPEQSLNIYKTLCASVKNGQRVLDLYCGIGISSLFLARQGLDVTGVEFNAEAVKLARNNAQQNGLQAQFIQGDVKAVLEQLMHEKRADCIILNPPREGLDREVIDIVKKNAPTDLIYISCMPPTLARDLQHLVGDGDYRIKKCQAFDMFPQTAHVETLVQVEKN